MKTLVSKMLCVLGREGRLSFLFHRNLYLGNTDTKILNDVYSLKVCKFVLNKATEIPPRLLHLNSKDPGAFIVIQTLLPLIFIRRVCLHFYKLWERQKKPPEFFNTRALSIQHMPGSIASRPKSGFKCRLPLLSQVSRKCFPLYPVWPGLLN